MDYIGFHSFGIQSQVTIKITIGMEKYIMINEFFFKVPVLIYITNS